MSKKFFEDQSGYTLIELLLVISLLTLAVGVSTDIILTLVRSYGKTQVTTEIEQNSNFVFLKLEKELRNAQTVTSITATSISFNDSNNVPVTYAIATVNGVSAIQRTSGGLTFTITNTDATSGVSVTCNGAGNACFRQISAASATPLVVELDMSFSQVGSPNASFTGNVDLNDTIVVRGTY